jgi:hypothetical protein
MLKRSGSPNNVPDMSLKYNMAQELRDEISALSNVVLNPFDISTKIAVIIFRAAVIIKPNT